MFDAEWYREANPDVRAAGVDPFQHYLRHGWRERRRASPLFDSLWYVAQYPEVGQQSINPLLHFVDQGVWEGKDPNALFDTDWYLARSPAAKRSGLNPFIYYLRNNAREGGDPSPAFDTRRYLQEYPDVAASGIDALIHYLKWGTGEGRRRFVRSSLVSATEMYAASADVTGAAMSAIREDRLTDVQAFFGFRPLNVTIDSRRAALPTLSILLPAVLRRHATGGPNTAYILGSLLAREGIPVDFVSVDISPDEDLAPLKAHLRDLTGIDVEALHVGFRDASVRERAYPFGFNDVLMATAWWTAQPARSAAGLLRNKRIYYLIQDFESLFYGTSEKHAAALETYGFHHLPIINSAFLRDHLVHEKVGRFADRAFASNAIVFEPAVDRSHFFPEPARTPGVRRLLFYARPTMAERNLFGLGVAALRGAVDGGLFGDGGWEFIGMGEPFEPIPLGQRHVLKPIKWLDFAGYGALMRSADLLLSLMMSPHPSYPPLEMAACGGVVVTTEYGVKTAERLRQVSPHIIAVQPNIEELVFALTRGVLMSEARRHRSAAPTLAYPSSWVDSLSSVVPRLMDELRSDGILPRRPGLPAPQVFLKTGAQDVPADGSMPASYQRLLLSRQQSYRAAGSAGPLSLVTVADGADGARLADLAHSVFAQDSPSALEWLIVERATADSATRDVVSRIAADARVRRIEAPSDMGRAACLRLGLERAGGQYVVPLDANWLLLPDAVRVLQAFIEQSGQPVAIYADSDQADAAPLARPTRLPDWDPVLFLHAPHLIGPVAMDRAAALQHGCFDGGVGDELERWDAMLRLASANAAPTHLSEILSARRNGPATAPTGVAMDAGVTRYLRATGASPAVTWDGAAARTVLASHPDLARGAARFATCVVPDRVERDALRAQITALPAGADVVMLLGDTCRPTSDPPLAHIGALFALFQDAVMIGGQVHNGTTVLEAGYVFGHGGFIGCPDLGRPVDDPGYLRFMRTPRSVAAVSARCGFVARAFLEKCLEEMPCSFSLALLGSWLGAAARRQGRRVIYTPACDATISSPAVANLQTTDHIDLAIAFGDRANDRVGYALGLSKSGESPYEPAMDEVVNPIADYRTYLDREATIRGRGIAVDGGASPTISVLTTVYGRTNAALFEATAEAMRAQTRPAKEWLVLAHGPIDDGLAAILARLSEAGAITWLRHDVNLGIHGGLRYCLERATGDYALALDADDLLTPDALALLADASRRLPQARVFYSDEDFLVDGKPTLPFYRPDFDPVHLRAHSYIWHAIMFDRRLALELGAYTSADVQFALDWDVLLRFDASGHRPVHLPHVLYHWRQHANSLSNSGRVNDGTLRSIRGALESIRGRSAGPDNMSVEPYPIDVGMPDFYLKRLERDAPPTSLLSLRPDEAKGQRHAVPAFPFHEIASIAVGRGPRGRTALESAMHQLTDDLIVIMGGAVEIADAAGLWQAVKHLELVPEAVAVGGALCSIAGRVIFGAPVRTGADTLFDPLAGQSMLSPSRYSINVLKAHCVDALSVDLMVARRDAMLAALEDAPPALGLRSLGWWIAEFAARRRQVVAYEPLLRGFVRDERALLGDPVSGLQAAISASFDTPSDDQRDWRGVARFEAHRRLHSS
ncbi:MAG TPA: glycosyltransferase [Vineibacter sp.]|nr:glycosyltransferase [Vineibacter sp.]